MLAASIGLYQSYMSVALTLMIFSSILSLLDGDGSGRVIRKGLSGIAIVLIGGVLYYLGSKVALSVTGVSLEERTNVFAYSGLNFFGICAELIYGTIHTYIDFCNRLIFYLLLRSELPNIIIKAVVFILALTILFMVFSIFRRNRQMRMIDKLLACALGLLMPLGIHITYLLSRGFMHDLMTYAFCLIYIAILVLVFRYADQYHAAHGLLLKGLCVAAVGVLLWGNIVVANTAYIKKDLEQKSTLSTMTRVVSAMEAQDEYQVGETPVAFIQVSALGDTVPGFYRIAEVTGLWSTSAITYDYKSYFDYILNYPVNICSDDVHAVLKANPKVQEMPSFPDQGYIQMVDDVMVVKMGDYEIQTD